MCTITVLLGLFFSELLPAARAPMHPPIRIGFIGSLSGSPSGVAKEALKQLQVTLNVQNKLGGIGGRELRVKAYDTNHSPAEIYRIFRELKQDGVVIITGVFSNNEGMIITDLAEKRHLPTIVTSASLSRLTRGRRYVIRMGVNADREAEVTVKFLRGRLQARHTVQVVDAGDSFSLAMGELFKRKFELDGGTVLKTFLVRAGEKEFFNLTSELNALKHKPDLIISMLNPQSSGQLVAVLSNEKLLIPVMGNSTWQGDSLAALVELTSSKDSVLYFPIQPVSLSVKEATVADPSVALTSDAGEYIVQALKNSSSVEPHILMRSLRDNQVRGLTGAIQIKGGKDPMKLLTMVMVKKGVVLRGDSE